MKMRCVLKWLTMLALYLLAIVCFFLLCCEITDGESVSLATFLATFICVKALAFANTAALVSVARKLNEAGYIPKIDGEREDSTNAIEFRKGGGNERTA